MRLRPTKVQCTLLVIGVVLLLPRCTEQAMSPQAASGDGTLHIIAKQYDESSRIHAPDSPVSLMLRGGGYMWRGVIPHGDTSFDFTYLPYQDYVLRAEEEGAFPFESNASVGGPGNGWKTYVTLWQLPSPSKRIDSIQYAGGLIRLVTAEPAPSSQYAAIFSGPTPGVSPQPGTYAHSYEVWEPPGSNEILMNFPPEPGRRVYVTARLATGATRTFLDTSTSNIVFMNLEGNSKLVIAIDFP